MEEVKMAIIEDPNNPRQRLRDPNSVEIPPKPVIKPGDFSGKVYAVVYLPHPQGFANYTVATLEIDKGKVKSIELGDYWAAQETEQHLDYLNERLIDQMKQKYPAGYQHVG
jgi:hypothetical protein